MYYYRSPLYWIRSMDFLPHFDSGQASRSLHHFKDFGLSDAQFAPVVGCVINSTIFYLWFIAYGNAYRPKYWNEPPWRVRAPILVALQKAGPKGD